MATFFSVAVGRIDPDRLLLLIPNYHTIPDEDYIDDPRAGARIGSAAIRAALQRILDCEFGQLHVHLHEHKGSPRPSTMDMRETPRLIESMVATDATRAHGAVILSHDSAWAKIWVPGIKQPVLATKITVVGFPFRFLQR